MSHHGSGPQQIDHLIGRLLSSFRRHRFVIPAPVVAEAKKGLEMATKVSDLGRIAELRFVLGFALLWADQIEESETWLAKAINDAQRIGDAVLENRAAAYQATCLRRLSRVEEAVDASQAALTKARGLKDRHYEGHALANLCWTKWRMGATEEAKRLGLNAFEAWGEKEDDWNGGLDTEFAFLAVWPMVAIALEEDALLEARGHLHYLCAPWERRAPSELESIVDHLAHGGPSPGRLREAIRLARQYRLA